MIADADIRQAIEILVDRFHPDRVILFGSHARDIVVLSREEFERDRHIPGTVARPAAREGRILYERP